MSKTKYLEKYGPKIAQNGYEVIPIIPGQKRPFGKEWQDYDGSPAGVKRWLRSGKAAFGVGILTKHSPAVDIDVMDPEVVDELIASIEALVGSTLRRVGLAPKTLLAYQTDKPFPKVDSGRWVDTEGRIVKCEILADGQQYVAAAIHPDTKKPYQWLDSKSVVTRKRSALPILREKHAEAIRDEAIRLFESLGYVRYRKGIDRMHRDEADEDDVFAHVNPQADITDEELHAKLLLVPGNEDYDVWVSVGMALWHQYRGEQHGLDLWHEWSQTADNYDDDALEKHWISFNDKSKKRKPLTARIIIKWAVAEERRIREESLVEVLNKIVMADSIESLQFACEEVKHIQFDRPVREMIVGKVKSQFKKITDTTPGVAVVRDMVRYQDPNRRVMPHWLKNWVYCSFDRTYYNTKDRRVLDERAFDTVHGRVILSPADILEGNIVPENSASTLAQNQYEMPSAYMRMYLPGASEFFTYEGIDYVNLYSEDSFPQIPEELSAADKEVGRIIEAHTVHLIRHEAERNMLLDWIAYIVQNPGQRVSWAILLQGTEGDGKTWFARLMETAMGAQNVNVISGVQIEEQYNPWAEGAMVCFVEDVRLHGANRFDVVNKLKPVITNDVSTIRRMRTDPYKIINTISWFLTANMKDALPLDGSDSRFYPIFSRFQNKRSLEAFKAENPTYYSTIWGVLKRPGAVRHYFLNRELGKGFYPKSRAPESAYRAEMIQSNKSEEEELLEQLLVEERKLDFCEELMDTVIMEDHFARHGVEMPHTKALHRFLSERGMTALGRFKINGEMRRFWTAEPERWPSDSAMIPQAVRKWLQYGGL